MFPRNTIQASSEQVTNFTIQCKKCKTKFPFLLNSTKIKAWQAGEKIQDVFPELTVDDRELLISGVCDRCFDEMWPE